MTNLNMPPIAPVPFNGVMVFIWIAVFLIIGMILRATFPIFRRYLIPSCIIGGTVGFIFQSTGLINATGFPLDAGIAQNLMFHLFNLTWVYIGLRVPPKDAPKNAFAPQNIFWCAGLMVVSCAGVMTLATLATTVASYAGLNSGPATIGSLTGFGFVTGPGQSFTIANLWAAATSYTGLPDFALATGAMGFATAIIVGVFFMNIIARKKKLDLITCLSEEEECGFYGECTPTEDAGKQTTSATSIDVLAWHIGIGLVTYFLSFSLSVLLFIILPTALKIYVWSIFYLTGAITAICVRKFLVKINKGHLLCAGMNSRVSNTVVDFMVCATFMSIQVGNIVQYLAPFFISVVTCTVGAAIIVWLYTCRLKEEGPETFAYVFGQITGTISTAFILLRLIDPTNKSTVPIRMALAGTVSMASGIIIPIIMHMEPLYGQSAWMAVGSFFALAMVGFIVTMIFRQPTTKTAWEPNE